MQMTMSASRMQEIALYKNSIPYFYNDFLCMVTCYMVQRAIYNGLLKNGDVNK